ncbi:MAG: DUF3341 domain-containing protein [Thermoanaerobaculia bacterium]|nr:DUF3341 domain-containing protein [Thermoanaerobaculia bacterium]
MRRSEGIFALLAEFESRDALLDAIRRTREAGYTVIEAYTPYPSHRVIEALGHPESRLPRIVLAGGLLGCLAGFGLQAWTSIVSYPLNVGGRPFFSWPAFIPVTFELTILFAAGAAVLGMFALSGLPQPYHPVFNVDRFTQASRDGYFLAIAESDPKFDEAETRSLLEATAATGVYDVHP